MHSYFPNVVLVGVAIETILMLFFPAAGGTEGAAAERDESG